MKRILAILLTATLLIGMMPLGATMAVAETYATVTSENGYGVRLREGPGTGYRVVTTYSVGTSVTVLSQGASWCKLQLGSTVGWMMTRFLNIGGTSSGSTGGGTTGGSVIGIGNAVVTSKNGKGVWLRTKASGKRIALYSVGTSVTVLQKGGTWSNISIGGTIGWMMTEFLNFGSTTTTPPVSKTITNVALNYSAPVVGDVLEANITPAGATATYVWTRVDANGAVKEVSNTATYTVAWEDVNCKITVAVTGIGSNKGYQTASTSEIAGTRDVTGVALSKMNPAVGDVLTPVVTPSSATVNCIWLVAGVNKSTNVSYTVTQSDVGKRIQLKVTGTGDFSGSAICTASDDVISDKQVTNVVLSNKTPLVGDTLTATVTPANATVNYSWTCDTDVLGTGSSYKVTSRELGKTIKLTITGKDTYSGSDSDTTETIAKAYLESVTINTTTPLLQQSVYATVKPAGASADFTWYVNDVEVDRGDGFLLNDTSYAGKKIKVKAVGTGVYSGTVTSAATNAIVDDTKVTSVTLSNMSPVAGDVLTAICKPATIQDVKGASYIWTVGTQTFSSAESTYTVTSADIGKTIRVEAKGTGNFTGSAKSEYTKAVIANAEVTAVAILIQGSNANASKTSPEIGQTLVASVTPGNATVNYEWRVGNTVLKSETTNTLKLDSIDWRGQRVTLKVTAKGNYKGTRSVTTSAISKSQPLAEVLNLAAPKAGNKPATSLKVDKKYTATVQWIPALDQFGNFKPQTDYKAAITITPASGWTMNGSTSTAKGASSNSISGNVLTAVYPTTGNQQINLYNIDGVKAPVAGETPQTTITNTAQFTGSVNWSPETATFQAGQSYTATINLNAVNGYEFASLPANVFTVIGASASRYTAGGTVVTADYSAAMPLVEVQTESINVLLDGAKSVSMPVTAKLTNYESTQTLTWKWSMTGQEYSTTQINADTGILSIAAKETTGKRLVVTATAYLDGSVWEINGKPVKGELSIQLSPDDGSGIDPNAIQVEILNSVGYIQAGKTARFTAIARNSTQGVSWYLVGSGKNPAGGYYSTCSGGYLEVGVGETAKTIVVVAVSKEDGTVHAEFAVNVGTSSVEPLSLMARPGAAAPVIELTDQEIADMLANSEWVLQDDGDVPSTTEPVEPTESTDGEDALAEENKDLEDPTATTPTETTEAPTGTPSEVPAETASPEVTEATTEAATATTVPEATATPVVTAIPEETAAPQENNELPPGIVPVLP